MLESEGIVTQTVTPPAGPRPRVRWNGDPMERNHLELSFRGTELDHHDANATLRLRLQLNTNGAGVRDSCRPYSEYVQTLAQRYVTPRLHCHS